MAWFSKYKSRLYVLFFLAIAASAHAQAEELCSTDTLPLIIALATPFETYPDTGGYSLLLTATRRFKSDPTLYKRPQKGDDEKTDVLEEWRDFVYSKLVNVYDVPLENRSDYCIGSDCDGAYNGPPNDQKIVTRTISKETFKFMRKKIPQLDVLITSLRVEVTERPPKDEPTPVFRDMYPDTEFVHRDVDAKELSLQSRMRIRTAEGSMGFFAETTASYGKITSLWGVNIRKPGDMSFAMKYITGKNTHLIFEREIRYKTLANAVYTVGQNRITENALRFVYFF